ncbi:13175_t:CDS:2 [Dentiscutata erythropus]|uniref:13175_t:CDS:1 n=1 Tax=Dentiscutata erythropus TaxID=1348616 RepID=A0A9N9E0Y6_9GLOM|nr:13175_t:CDS:2 [Dentiscutata erythropus]
MSDSNFPWDFASLEDNVEAQKLLAAAIAHNDQYRFDEDQKRKLEMLEDAAQQTPSKASHKLNITSVPHPDLDAESEGSPSPPDNSLELSNEPQKKKPGRKPLTNTPSNKRKAQNRAAQRAFRERKERYVKELETKIEELESMSAKSAQENQQLKSLVEQLQAENYLLKQTSFTFDFPLPKTNDTTSILDKDINDLVGAKSISPPPIPASNTSEPYTPPSSSTSDDEPGSPNSVSDKNVNVTVSSPDISSQAPSSKLDQPNLPSKSSGSASSSSSHSTKPQSAEEFCEKFTDGMCQDNNTSFDMTGSSNGATDLNKLSSAFTEYRDPTPFTPNIDNPFSESAPLPPLFEDSFQDFGSFAPMATPTDENKNPHFSSLSKHEFASLEDIRSKKFLSCNKVWERIQQHPKFDDLEGDEIDQLCAELKSKAKCSGKGPVVPEEDVEAVLIKLEEK